MERYRKQAEIKRAHLKEIERCLDEAGKSGLRAVQIAGEVGLSRWSVTKHLNELRDQGLVYKVGPRFIATTPREWDPIAKLMEDRFTRELWDEFERMMKAKPKGRTLRVQMAKLLRPYVSILACCVPYAIRAACRERDKETAIARLVEIWESVMIDRATAIFSMIHEAPKESMDALKQVEEWMRRRLST